MYEYDVIVIGGGSGGCATAIRATDLGLKVLLVEKRKKDGLGGTCINRGCIPTKALMETVTILDGIRKAATFGVEILSAVPDIAKVMKNKDKIQNQLQMGLKTFILGSRKIPIVYGEGRLLDGHRVEVIDGEESTVYEAENIMLATGSDPAMIPQFHIDRIHIITSDEALCLTETPKSLLVVGGGVIGLEMAIFFKAMGTDVTIVEALPNVAQVVADQETSDMVKKLLQKRGIKIITGVAIDEIRVTGDNEITASLGNGEVICAEKALVSIGRKTNLDGLGLDEVGIATENGRIVTNEQMQTSVPSVYAVGDITAGTQLSHKAQNEGVTASEIMAGNEVRLEYSVLPWVIFSKPEIAKVGFSKSEAEANGIAALESKLLMTMNEKAACSGVTEGMIKLIARTDTHEIIGGILLCEAASSLVGEIAIAMRSGMSLETLSTTIHAHPTYTEAIMECAKSALGKAYHK